MTVSSLKETIAVVARYHANSITAFVQPNRSAYSGALLGVFFVTAKSDVGFVGFSAEAESGSTMFSALAP
jgi:hypothetical protein